MNRILITVLGIVAAVGGSGIVFVGINKLFDLTETRYAQFNAIVGGLVSAGRVRTAVGESADQLAWCRDPHCDRHRRRHRIRTRRAHGTRAATRRRRRRWSGSRIADGDGRETCRAAVDRPGRHRRGLAIGAGIGLLVWLMAGRRGNRLSSLLAGTAIGWLFGAWLAADLDGSRAEVVIVAVVLGALIGTLLGTRPHPNQVKRAEIAVSSRKFIFLTPALLFVSAALVIPLGRTIWLGFLTGNPRELRWNGLTNYSDLFSDPGIIDFSGFGDIFTSRLFLAAVILLVVGAVVGRLVGRGLGTGFSLDAGSLSLLGGGAALLGFALFTSVRGTIANNLWWIFSVIIFAVSLGLAVAVLADRSKGENIAKSFIFLPMAISFVGAGVIWRLIYVARPSQDPQTGVFNTLWVQLGKWSNSGFAQTVIGLLLGLIIVGLLYLGWRGWQAEANPLLAGSLAIERWPCV